jgi:hypothetical protein
MPELCPECGAQVPEGGSCRDNFHALLLLESEVPGLEPLMHFYVVGSYNLQHPDSMNFTAEALAGLRANLADSLDGRKTIDQIRRVTRRNANGAARVTRRAGDAEVSWRPGGWPMNVADVCKADVHTYADHVLCWARSVRDTLDAHRTRDHA